MNRPRCITRPHTSRNGIAEHRCRRLQALQAAVPQLVAGLESSLDGAHHAAVAITTTDLVSKSAALEVCTSAPGRAAGFVFGLVFWVWCKVETRSCSGCSGEQGLTSVESLKGRKRPQLPKSSLAPNPYGPVSRTSPLKLAAPCMPDPCLLLVFRPRTRPSPYPDTTLSRAATGRDRRRDGARRRHRQGQRHDPPQHGDHAVRRHLRRRRGAAPMAGAVQAQRRQKFQPGAPARCYAATHSSFIGQHALIRRPALRLLHSSAAVYALRTLDPNQRGVTPPSNSNVHSLP